MELELVRFLAERIKPSGAVALGIGDDAALLRVSPGMQAVVTTDMLMDGIDFVLADCDPRLIGRKALAVNLSDLAAMAARPIAAFVALALPRSAGLDLPKRLYEGMLPLAEKYGATIAGGDTNVWAGPLCISITAVGEVPEGKAWRRSGAQVGDELLITGPLGGSILGKHLTFEPRVAEALAIAQRCEIHAALDISDGLALDAWRLAEASGCGVAIDLARLPIAAAAHQLASIDGRPALEHALSDGEDFELLLAATSASAAQLCGTPPDGLGVAQIGRIVAERGLWSIAADGPLSPLKPQGFEHR
jgi:thiamine-monophosphate kinase